MYIYKVIARFGLDCELDSTIYSTYKTAMKAAYDWLKIEDVDSVDIYDELPDKELGFFRTVHHLQHLTKPF